jgi:hypothetical protein
VCICGTRGIYERNWYQNLCRNQFNQNNVPSKHHEGSLYGCSCSPGAPRRPWACWRGAGAGPPSSWARRTPHATRPPSRPPHRCDLRGDSFQEEGPSSRQRRSRLVRRPRCQACGWRSPCGASPPCGCGLAPVCGLIKCWPQSLRCRLHCQTRGPAERGCGAHHWHLDGVPRLKGPLVHVPCFSAAAAPVCGRRQSDSNSGTAADRRLRRFRAHARGAPLDSQPRALLQGTSTAGVMSQAGVPAAWSAGRHDILWSGANSASSRPAPSQSTPRSLSAARSAQSASLPYERARAT